VESPACPPHHWQITSREEDRVVYDHHTCVRCGAQKDTVRAPLTTHSPWSKKTPARAAS
jgi:hypothetical protein